VGLRELLGSLGTISSILAGFVLAGLISLAAEGPSGFSDPLIQAALLCWLASGLLILLVLVMAELLRRQETSDRIINATPEETRGLEQKCERLLTVFALSLALTAVGIVVLGFYYSWLHGLLGIAMVPICVEVGRRTLI
jgi:hypothetical protein